jgi:hypothetical protein
MTRMTTLRRMLELLPGYHFYGNRSVGWSLAGTEDMSSLSYPLDNLANGTPKDCWYVLSHIFRDARRTESS